MLTAYFFHSRLSQHVALIKVDWLDACIARRVVGAVLVVFLRHWRKICTIIQSMGSKARNLTKCLKPCWLIRSKETWTKHTPLTLLSQCKLALTATKKNKNWPRPLFRPRSDHACHHAKAKSISWDNPFNVLRRWMLLCLWHKVGKNESAVKEKAQNPIFPEN